LIHNFGNPGDGFAPDAQPWDLCIVGAGAAGLALAAQFLDTPWRVLVLESGLSDPDAFGNELNVLDSVGMRHDGWRDGRVRSFGGTTRAWGGQRRPTYECNCQHGNHALTQIEPPSATSG